MTPRKAASLLAKRGFPCLEIHKAGGVWYIVGGADDPRIDQSVERCLHITALKQLEERVLVEKLAEMRKDPCQHRMLFDLGSTVFCAVCGEKVDMRIEHADHPNNERYVPREI